MSRLYRHDRAIRAAGLFLVLAAAVCLWSLFTGPAAQGRAGPLAALEAAIGFAGMSWGAALLTLGRHVHDRIAPPRPWGTGPGRRARSPAPTARP
jgi:hypothetical protein